MSTTPVNAPLSRPLWLVVLSWAGWGLTRPVVWPYRLVRFLLGSFRFWALVVLAVIATLVGYFAVADRVTPLTTDAYVQAYVVQLAPQVAGRVVRVGVRESDRVSRGTLLYELDARPFEHRVRLLEAKLVETRTKVKQLRTQLAMARDEQRRLKAEADLAGAINLQEQLIFKKEATTERKYLEARSKHRASLAALDRSTSEIQHVEEALASRIGPEHALVAQVQAELASARLDLSYTRVMAPCDGIITDLQLREGAYVHVGQAALSVIDTSRWVVVANFRENSLGRMRVGQPALVALQTMPGELMPARIESLGWGVDQGQGVPSGKLPAVKRDTTWVQSAQRFQVRLVLDEEPAVALRVGQTGSVSVYTDLDEEDLNAIARAVHRLVAWLYYL
jgi:multidrug resistance efflux pump